MIQIDNFSFLIIIFLSYILVRRGLDPKVFAGIPKLLFTFCYPALILVSFAVLDSDLSHQDVVFTVAFTAISTGLIYLPSLWVLRHYGNEGRKELIAFYMVIGNVTFVGLPFIFYFFGLFGLSFAILFGVVQDVFVWSVCYARFAGKSNPRQLIKTVLNPCFIAVIAGFIFAANRWPLPGFVQLPVQMLADATIPLALLCVGSLLAQNRDSLKIVDRDVILSVGIKTFLIPIIGFAVLRVIGVDPALALLCSFILCMPAPLLSILFAKEFGKDAAFANVVFVVSVLAFLLVCIVLFFLQTMGVNIFIS